MTTDSFNTFDNQFYPTPPSLGRKLFAKFKNKEYERFLEPSAGRGDLADIVYNPNRSNRKQDIIDCIEINLANQAILKEKGYRVVASDFLAFRSPAMYSHILLNPPFKQAASHVLHAWDILLDGELCAIVAAHTIKNPRSPEARQLVRVIEDHGGEVEFVESAFTTEDTKRTTAVEVALIHLEKRSTNFGHFIHGLQKEVEQRQEAAPEMGNEVMLPKDFITNQVLNFECAAEAIKTACMHHARANYYGRRFDMSIMEEEGRAKPDVFPAQSFNKKYDELKERAWSTILRSSNVMALLSSQAQKRLEGSFKEICNLEFTYENIWGFVDGLIRQQGEIQISMCCDVFDEISRYHTENRAYYQGWKSNDKHRLNAFRIKTTRFILPRCRSAYDRSLSWDDEKRLSDFDKVFAMLDKKKAESTFTLHALFQKHFDELRAGERLSCDYFDVRYYPKRGTVHFFPRRKDLIDRLNEVVGKHRQWIPHDKNAAPAAFWKQYDKAEQITAKMGDTEANRWGWWAFRNNDEDDRDVTKARDGMMALHEKAMAELGINYHHSMLLEHEQQPQTELPLLEVSSAA